LRERPLLSVLAGLTVRGPERLEPLPEGFRAFWISSPANIIHLVSEDTAS